ncbi:MAG: DUF5668 domain-containing protein [bacterium]
MQTKKMDISFQLIIGLIIIGIGVVFTLDNMGLIEAGEFLVYWPALLILYGTVKVVQCEGLPCRLWGGLWILVGSLILLRSLDIFFFRIWNLWPLFLVLLGFSMIWGSMKRKTVVNIFSGERSKDSNSTISGFALMGGFKRTNDSQEFSGGELTAIMGGIEVDLRRASIKEGEEAVLDLFAFWGGIEIRVPEDWIIVLEGIPLLGGFEDRTMPPKGGPRKKLVIKGYAIMGGVEIKS